MLKDQIELLEAFNADGVEYLVVGGHAVSAHGTPRMTKDLDVWINPKPENGPAVYRALASFGAPLAGMNESDLSGHPETVLQIGVDPHRIDVMQSISGVTFEEAWARRVKGLVDGRVPVCFLSAEDLITNKLSVGRARDLGDVEDLRNAAKGSDD